MSQLGSNWPTKMKKYLKEQRQIFIEKYIGNTLVIAKNPLPEDINIDSVIRIVKNLIPEHFFENIDSIYIGQFDNLKSRDLSAMYSEGAIYITNEQHSEEDMAEELIHEIAHSVEETIPSDIYGDGRVAEEFRSKRRALYSALKGENHSVELSDYLELDYSEEFDDFLYTQIGYPMLSAITIHMFYSPYGATSLREYFANGFEAYYYHRDVNFLKKISPILFDKVKELGYNRE